MAHLPLPIHLIPTRGLVSDTLADSGTITRDVSPEFLISGGWLSATASDYPEESGVSHAPYFRGAEYTSIEIIPGGTGYDSPYSGLSVNYTESYAGGEDDYGGGSTVATIIRPIDPTHLRNQLTLIKEEDKIERFNGSVNCFTHRRGREPSNGFFLVLKSDISEGLIKSFHTLVKFRQFSDLEASIKGKDFVSQAQSSNNDVTIKELFLVQAVAVTPVITGPEFDANELSAASDVANQVYLIELADRRGMGKFVHQAWGGHTDYDYVSRLVFNVRSPGDNPKGEGSPGHPNNTVRYIGDISTSTSSAHQYYVESKKYSSGSYIDWTWESMLTKIWESVGPVVGQTVGGVLTTLDFSNAQFPTHVPENYKESDSETPYDFFFDVLDSIFHTLVRTLEGAWLVVGPGKLVGVEDSPRNMMRIARHHLQDCLNHIDTKWNRLPAFIKILFPKNTGHFGGGSVLALDRYEIDVDQSVMFQVRLTSNFAGGKLPDINTALLADTNSYSVHESPVTYTGGMPVDKMLKGSFMIHDRLRARYGRDNDATPTESGTSADDVGYIQGGLKIETDLFVNYSDLATRATELATLYRDFIIHTDPLVHRKYNGFWKFEGTHRIEEITWGDIGDGPFTILNNPSRKGDEVTKMVKPIPRKVPPVNRISWARILGESYGSYGGPFYRDIQPCKWGTATLLNLVGDPTTGIVTPNPEPGFSDGSSNTEGPRGAIQVHNVHHTRPLKPGEIVPVIWDETGQCWAASSPGGAEFAQGTEVIRVIAQEDWQKGTGSTEYDTRRDAHVSVKAAQGSGGYADGDGTDAPVFDVYFVPASPQGANWYYLNTDPNVVSGQSFYAARYTTGQSYGSEGGRVWPSAANDTPTSDDDYAEDWGYQLKEGDWYAVDGYLDAAIGTVKLWSGDGTIGASQLAPRQGWGLMDGTANASGNGGSGIDMREFLLQGGTGLAETGDTEGKMDGSVPAAPPTQTASSTTFSSITTNTVTHSVELDDETFSPYDAGVGGPRDVLLDTTDVTISPETHSHTVTGGGATAHTHDFEQMASKKLAFYERLDNSGS